VLLVFQRDIADQDPSFSSVLFRRSLRVSAFRVRAIFVTRAQWERSFVLQGAPAEEGAPENLPEQIQLW
jgi:hypothetical protein